MATQVQAAPVSEQKLSRYRSVRNAASKTISSPAYTAEIPPAPTEALARSRSRYRGSRPNLPSGKPLSSCTSTLPLQQDKITGRPLGQPDAVPETIRAHRDSAHPQARSRQAVNPSDKYQEEEFQPRSIKRALPEVDSRWQPDAVEDVASAVPVKLPTKQSIEHKANRSSRDNWFKDVSEGKIGKYGEAPPGQNAEKISSQWNSVERGRSSVPAWVDPPSFRHPIPSRDTLVPNPLGPDHGVRRESNTRLRKKVVQPLLATDHQLKKEKKVEIDEPSIIASGRTDRGQSSENKTTALANQNVVPNFDAPISAVNTGQRNVTVNFNGSTLSLPITPITTTFDVLGSAAKALSGVIIPETSVLLECYKQLGLERPLRRYERIRDVLNSWDNDSQNILIIELSPTEGSDYDLGISSVAKKQPLETSVQIDHSQKPGKWDKRWVTLRSDGQVLISKSNGDESVNICHMSDFDIYIPTSRQLKKIKPPKKICFAVKSQQKSSMFLSTANFVHFFSTKDKNTAMTWYKAVQQWRSWYLVHVMGEGQERSHRTEYGPQERVRNKMPQEVKHTNKAYAESRTFRNGTSEASPPTVALEHVTRSNPTASLARPSRADRSAEMGRSSSSERQLNNTVRPNLVSPPRKLTKTAPGAVSAADMSKPTVIRGVAPSISRIETFDANGLLGNMYEQRQKAQHNRGEISGLSPGPARSHTVRESPSHNPRSPIHAPTSRSPEQVVSKRHVQEHTDGLKRTLTTRQAPKPLIDLTPKYQEPPQHSRKGKGVVPDVIPPGGLIDIATTPEMAIMIPAATTFRRPDQHDVQTVQRTKTMHGTATRPSRLMEQSARVYNMEEDELRAGGMISKASKGQNEFSHGKGAVTGDRRAKGPLIDISRPSEYAPGSLLADVERMHSGEEPAV